MNFQDWAVTDIPGQGSLDLNTFLCKQPVSVVVYDFTAASASATAHRARWVAIGCKAHCMFAIRNLRHAVFEQLQLSWSTPLTPSPHVFASHHRAPLFQR